jgi:hypothetical protein
MRIDIKKQMLWLVFVPLVAGAAFRSAYAEDTNPPTAAAEKALPSEVELRGRVVCLPEEMHRLYGTELDPKHAHLYGFKTDDGTYYTLMRTELSEALFVDARLREKELLLKGHAFPRTGIFEVTNMKSIKDGVVYDLYYYCDVCNIKTVSPGPCMCCQGPVRLVEESLK